MVGGAGEDVGLVGKVGGAQHRLPVGATLDVADVVGAALGGSGASARVVRHRGGDGDLVPGGEDRKSTRLNSSHVAISYAVFCLKKKSIYINFALLKVQEHK